MRPVQAWLTATTPETSAPHFDSAPSHSTPMPKAIREAQRLPERECGGHPPLSPQKIRAPPLALPNGMRDPKAMSCKSSARPAPKSRKSVQRGVRKPTSLASKER